MCVFTDTFIVTANRNGTACELRVNKMLDREARERYDLEIKVNYMERRRKRQGRIACTMKTIFIDTQNKYKISVNK